MICIYSSLLAWGHGDFSWKDLCAYLESNDLTKLTKTCLDSVALYYS